MRTPSGLLALGAFMVGCALYTAPTMQNLLQEVAWEHLPSSLAEVSWERYEATFMPVAAAYLTVLDETVELQVEAYRTVGKGASAAALALGETKPVAAVAEWYVGLHEEVESRLSPQ